jgi:hypothetical protein
VLSGQEQLELDTANATKAGEEPLPLIDKASA